MFAVSCRTQLLARLLLLLLSPALCTANSWAGLLDLTGVSLLRQTTTNLNGDGIVLGQVEASNGGSPPTFEVNPGHLSIQQPGTKFIYHSTVGTATNYPNAVGGFSGHATEVARYFFGISSGVTTNPAAVHNYDANYFINSVVFAPVPPAIPPRIVNQSYIFGDISVAEQIQYDKEFDNYAAANNTLFVSGVGNADTNLYGGAVNVPASCYNGIGVAAFGTLASSVGPTRDNGRCKPDLTAPNEGSSLVTSYTTPFVAGSAAVLLQAGLRGDGGSDTNAAGDMRTLKALLLNGAIKPSGWTNGPITPLDARHGAGMVNLFNSYRQLVGGQHPAIEQTTVGTGDAHPPGSNGSNVPAWSGWNFDSTLSTTMTQDRVKHYYFNLTNDSPAATFTLTATLAWNRQENETAINDLDLYLYDCATSNLVAESSSFVNNIEHLYARKLPPGRYDLQVWKAGGNAGNGRVTSSETYALAWEFFAMPLAVTQSDTNVILSWPIYPTGFAVEATPNLTAPNWTVINTPLPTLLDGTNHLTLPANASERYFRLRRPAF